MTKQQKILMSKLAHSYSIKQGSVEYESSYEDFIEGYKSCYDVFAKQIAVEYAEFCIVCDRKNMPLLCFDDYINQYC